MFNECLVLYVFMIQVYKCLEDLEGWNYINLHCRDNENVPVDWWYIYKPPHEAYPDRSQKFTFMTPFTLGRWELADRFISSNSMLQHTLSPMFRSTYKDYLAVVVYDERKPDNKDNGSLLYGLMMADEMGGLWVGHTVPNLVDLNRDRPSFPEKESDMGHLLMCFSLDLITLNELASVLKTASPKFSHIIIPPNMKMLLPEWSALDKKQNRKIQKGYRKGSTKMEFVTRKKMFRGIVLVRPPGVAQCLYRTFARVKKIVLDVYGDYEHNQHCDFHFGMRRIQSISLKYPTDVIYINNQTNRVGFAVSTVAHWQTRGSGPIQHWVCTGAIENKGRKGAMVLCVNDYALWSGFDNLKVKEPEC